MIMRVTGTKLYVYTILVNKWLSLSHVKNLYTKFVSLNSDDIIVCKSE